MIVCQCAKKQKPAVGIDGAGHARIYCRRCDAPLPGAVGSMAPLGLIPGEFSATIPPGATIHRVGMLLAIVQPDKPAKILNLADGKVTEVKP